MGCLLSLFQSADGRIPLEEETPKVYSWDKREEKNVQDYIIDGRKGETVVKHAGSVNGEQILIQNCENCNIYIFDYIATVSVDDCINCNIFLGPIKSSVFIRDCKECKVAVACQQYRTRDCFDIQTFLLCATQPIIESSSKMKFACFKYSYQQLYDQFRLAGLSVYNNNWSNIHDFTPEAGEDHFSYLSLESKVEDSIPIPQGEEFESMKISTETEASVVPQTWGKRRKPSDESCLVVFFHDGNQSESAAKFLTTLLTQQQEKISAGDQVDCVLIQSKEVIMSPDYSSRVFGSDDYINKVQQGPVIGLEVNGPNCVSESQAIVSKMNSATSGPVFVSSSAQVSNEQVEAFYNFADMQMGI